MVLNQIYRVWLNTLSFLKDSSHKKDLNNTFPICIGLKSTKHDVIERAFIIETHDLSNGIDNPFLVFLKCNARVHFEVVASLGDQSE